MKLGMEVGLGPGHILSDGDLAPLLKRGTAPIFGPYLLWPNGWISQGATWYGGRPRPRRHCVRWGPSSPLKEAEPPVFGSCLLWPNAWMDEDATWYGSRPRPRPHCARRRPSSPTAKGAQQSLLFSAHVYCAIVATSPI